jgi:hypothetical protein
LPLVRTTSVASRMLNKLNKDGKNQFDNDLSIVWDPTFDATFVEADATGTRDAHEAAKASNDQLFRTRTKLALKSNMQHIADSDSNTCLVAKTMDGILVYTNSMSTKVKEQAQANVVLATVMAEQKNSIKALSDSVALLRANQQKLRDDMSQGQTALNDKIIGVRNEMKKIGNELKSGM